MIEAAGGVVWRPGPAGAVEVAVVHRPRYDDWSLPKGKLEVGEAHLEAALREVMEETGLVCSAGIELPSTRYEDRNGRPKRVRYWAMEPIGGAFTPNDEVDELQWLTIVSAHAVLTYPHDRQLLTALLAKLEDL